MKNTSRLYFCSRCHTQVIICTRCDRGQRYCPADCRHRARSESLKRAGKKYQSKRSGRFNNAARQRRYRARTKQKVTHHTSTAKHLHDLLNTRLTETKKTQNLSFHKPQLHCHYCGAVCEPYLRHDFVHSSRFKAPPR